MNVGQNASLISDINEVKKLQKRKITYRKEYNYDRL